MASCCNGETRIDSSADEKPEHCPRCGEKGKIIARLTVAAMARLDTPAAHLAHSEFSLCPSDSCEAVYFAGDGIVLEQQDIRVPVFWKNPGIDVPLCYCFEHTRRSIADEVAATGGSTAFAVVSDAVRAGKCACDVKNPSGTCCLGVVRKYENECTTRCEMVSGREDRTD